MYTIKLLNRYIDKQNTMTKIAAIQMNSTADLHVNLEVAKSLINEASERGAEFLVLPENFALIGDQEQDKLKIMESFGSGTIQDFLSQQSQQHKIWLLAGTVPLQATVEDKVRASCLLYGPDGRCTYRYDKIHLFDVIVDQKTGESYRESQTLEAGTEIVVAQTPLASIGMSVCYDLRFPELYRAMHKDGVHIIAVPSAFTAFTGKAHWENLLRSRAIENLCYIVAANQSGRHNERETWGHSMILNPWGDILDIIEDGPGIAIADIDLEQQHALRQSFPCLKHRVLA